MQLMNNKGQSDLLRQNGTRADIARATGASHWSVGMWLEGRAPSLEWRMKLHSIYGIDPMAWDQPSGCGQQVLDRAPRHDTIDIIRAFAKSTVRVADDATIYVIDVTPELASILIESMDPGQRPIDKASLDRYRRHMEGGTWEWSNNPITVNSLGHVIDGQHRCRAAAVADFTIRDALVAVLDKATTTKEHRVDDGKPRTAKDLSRRRMRHAVAGGIIFEHAGLPGSGEYLRTMDEMEKARVRDACECLDELNTLDSACLTRRGRHIPSAIIGAFIRIIRDGGPTAMRWLMAVCTNGAIEGVIESTADSLGAYIGATRDKGVRQRSVAASAIIAWNCYAIGRPLKIVRNTHQDPPDVIKRRA